MKTLIAKILLCAACFGLFNPLSAQVPAYSIWKNGQWNARWITCPGVSQKDYGIYHFRKTFTLPAKPGKFTVHVSADNRYRLFVNGTPVLNGPARGDLYNWYFETLDIAPYLREGQNTIAALVWNMGVEAAVAQVTNQTAFTLEGEGKAASLVNTNQTWKTFHDTAYTPCSLDNGPRLQTYMVIGPGDKVNAKYYPWNWEQPAYNDAAWPAARVIGTPVLAGYGTDNFWCLVPRTIPLMEEKEQRLASVRRAGSLTVPDGFLQGKQSITIPANTTVSILADQSYNTVAYPQLLVSKGSGSSIKLTYAEAMFGKNGKANRNEIDNKEIRGNYDIFMPDGGDNRLFRPLWFRTFRYLQLDITTGSEALVLNDLYGMYTGYPFEEKASFTSDEASLKDIWTVGWRTARLCAGENYFDCPYYEQLQYEGDTRIQSLISLYVAGDDRLMRKAIHDFYCSRVPEGLTQGRYPSNRLQVIPPFSLYWVSMLYDYWMHRKDDAFIRQYLTAARGVLDWYEQKVDPSTGLVGPLKWWNFYDWSSQFNNGVPDGVEQGNSSVTSLHFAYTLLEAAPLFEAFGDAALGKRYRALAASINKAAMARCFNTTRNAMANTPEQRTYSQHAGIMAVLSGAVPASAQRSVLLNLMKDSTMSEATIYYRFYLILALKKAGMGDMYYEQLGPWRNMLRDGLTTFAEKEDPTRSDCHAWSASPNYDFLATICGIMPASPGFASVMIAPALGKLNHAEGSMPVPAGTLTVKLARQGTGGIKAEVFLPGNLNGTFRWNGQTKPLKPGKQIVVL